MLCWIFIKPLLLPNKIFPCSAYFLFVVILWNSATAAAVFLLFISLYTIFWLLRVFPLYQVSASFLSQRGNNAHLKMALLLSTLMWEFTWWKSLVRYSVTCRLVMLWRSRSWLCQFCVLSSYLKYFNRT